MNGWLEHVPVFIVGSLNGKIFRPSQSDDFRNRVVLDGSPSLRGR